VLGIPIKLSATPGSLRTAPPRLGEHTRDVLERDLGKSATEIERLVGERVVGISHN